MCGDVHQDVIEDFAAEDRALDGGPEADAQGRVQGVFHRAVEPLAQHLPEKWDLRRAPHQHHAVGLVGGEPRFFEGPFHLRQGGVEVVADQILEGPAFEL